MFDQAAAYIREISSTFGAHSEAQWHKLANDVLKQNADGKWIRHYDLGLSIPVKATTPESAALAEKMLWAAYDAIKCPTLLTRGALSDLTSKETATKMQQRGPKTQVVEIEGVGHAPTFVHPEQIALARKFLLNQ
jgi:pimeloyl-ACP methyl ester carboxylesterase